MSSNRLLNSRRFHLVLIAVLLVCIGSAAFGIYLLDRIDTLIHNQLYNFGLQFDHAWADTYYFYKQLMYTALAVPIALSILSIAAGFKRQNKKNSEPAPKLMSNLTLPRPQPAVPKDLKAKIKENKHDICCPTCEKVVSRPLVMLKFVDGENKEINVCPYCYHVLGTVENDKLSKSDVQIADSDKKLIH
jgi:uncharacterized Zn-finger protein